MSFVDKLTQGVFRSALLWGGLLTVGFYMLLDVTDQYFNPWLLRALTERWEAYLCTALFFVGVAALTIRGVAVGLQWAGLVQLPTTSAEGEGAELSAETILEELEKGDSTISSYLYERLKNVVRFAAGNSSGQELSRQLVDLADIDRSRMERHYELARLMIWALPAVGSLATVLGIAAAISQLQATNSAELIAGVTAGLAVAFDTFALALGYSILLVVYKFVTSQGESRLLLAVDQFVNDKMRQRLTDSVDTTSSQMDQLRQLTASMVKATERLAQQQAATPARTAVASSAEFDEQKMEAIMAKAMANAMQHQPVNGAMPTAGVPDLAGWKPLQQALQQVATYLARQQAKQENEGEVVQQLINIIDDELRVDQTGRPALRMHNGDAAAVGLWK
jgi:biopolymer transport protein ExbB/TolQ